MRFQLKDQVFLQPVAPDEIVFDIFVAPAGEQVAGVFIGEATDESLAGRSDFIAGSLGLVQLARSEISAC